MFISWLQHGWCDCSMLIPGFGMIGIKNMNYRSAQADAGHVQSSAGVDTNIHQPTITTPPAQNEYEM